LFGISLAELLFILVIALIVLGPERLPEVARTLAGWIRQIREASDDIQRTLMIEDQGSPDSENHLDRMMADQPIDQPETANSSGGGSGGSAESDAMSVPAIRPVALAPTRPGEGARPVEMAAAGAPKEGHFIQETLTPAPTLPW
jgi:Tat protein translocase TatB subunit